MTSGQFANQTQSNCAAPLLDLAAFPPTGGYIAGRHCNFGSLENGTTCCFPCPIQDWLYSQQWHDQLRVPNYLSILSMILCSFLMLSFAVLPSEATHRHYLSVGLLFPVLFISFAFAIPVTSNPDMCYDAITPNDMHSSLSCAWTGSLVTIGGIGSVVWVFLRSLWLHIRIFWDRELGIRFMWGSIIFGTLMPLVSLIAVLSVTGFSYRMGQTCLPNHEHALETFWIWLVIFASLAFILQIFTSGYCFYAYIRSMRRLRSEQAVNSLESNATRRKLISWVHVKQMFLLQWRNILVSVFVIIGSISFFIVFWRQNHKLGRVFNSPGNISAIKSWVICQNSSVGDEECRKYVKDFTVNRAAVLASLILASLVGVIVFLLFLRITMLQAWLVFLRRFYHRTIYDDRPPSPLLTSLEDAEKYQRSSSHKRTSSHYRKSISRMSISQKRRTRVTVDPPIELSDVEQRPISKPVTSETRFFGGPSALRLHTAIPESGKYRTTIPAEAPDPESPHAFAPHTLLHTQPASSRISQIQPTSPLDDSYTPTRSAPPPPRSPATEGRSTKTNDAENTVFSWKRKLSIHRTPSKVRGKISAPIPASFLHVDGAFLGSPTGRKNDSTDLGSRGPGL